MRPRPNPEQLGFEALLSDAKDANTLRRQVRVTAHLPGTMKTAVPFMQDLINRHHAAMLQADIETAMALRREAGSLATKLNGFEPGIPADEDAPGVLDRATRAADGAVPLWGQSGSFEIALGSMRVGIEMEGIFGIGASVTTWPGFAAHAVDWDAPFFSETGYRSFLGLSGSLQPGMLPDAFAREAVSAHIARDLKGKLRTIKPECRARAGKGS